MFLRDVVRKQKNPKQNKKPKAEQINQIDMLEIKLPCKGAESIYPLHALSPSETTCDLHPALVFNGMGEAQ